MKNKLSITYLILIIAPLFFGCRGPVKEENKNNASASSLSLHVGNEKYRSTWIISGLLSSASADPTRICITQGTTPDLGRAGFVLPSALASKLASLPDKTKEAVS